MTISYGALALVVLFDGAHYTYRTAQDRLRDLYSISEVSGLGNMPIHGVASASVKNDLDYIDAKVLNNAESAFSISNFVLTPLDVYHFINKNAITCTMNNSKDLRIFSLVKIHSSIPTLFNLFAIHHFDLPSDIINIFAQLLFKLQLSILFNI